MLFVLLFLTLTSCLTFLKINGGGLQATSFLPLFFSITLTVGVLGFNVFTFSYEMPFMLGDNLAVSEFISAASFFFTVTISYIFGVLLAKFFIKNKYSALHFNFSIPSYFECILVVLPAFFLVSAYGMDNLMYRGEYIPENIQAFKFLGKVTSMIILLFLHNMFKSRLAISFVYLMYFLIFLSYGTRMMAVLPLCYFISYSYFSSKKAGLLRLVMAIALSLLLGALALQVRRLGFHGLLPYLNNIFEYGINFDLLMVSVNYLTSFSYSLTAYLNSNIHYNVNDFYISIHPLSGSDVGWRQHSELLRVNKYVPYNAISELASMGGGVLSSYFLIAGFCLKYVEIKASKLGLVGIAFSFCVCVLFTMECLQYNLRSATRILYYSLLSAMLIVFFYQFKKFLPNKV